MPERVKVSVTHLVEISPVLRFCFQPNSVVSPLVSKNVHLRCAAELTKKTKTTVFRTLQIVPINVALLEVNSVSLFKASMTPVVGLC